MGHRAKHRKRNWVAERLEKARVKKVAEDARQAECARKRAEKEQETKT
jgi:hypothetical protein